MTEFYIGLMAGTSLDGIDAVVVDFANDAAHLIASHYTPFTNQLRKTIADLSQPGHDEINRLGELDVILGKAFAQAVLTLLQHAQLTATDIQAIGCHGQTIRHHPYGPHPFTLQIGDPNTIAALTGITTVADFRRKDIALGGQGAPLVPAFHQCIFANKSSDRVILNIGGIANITLLPQDPKQPITGYDTGPGNTLIDAWVTKNLHQPFDRNGEWARQGKLLPGLLEQWLADAYFTQPPPKSTGQDYFNLAWLGPVDNHHPVDIQATLVELTARSSIEAIQRHVNKGEIIVCGGGVHNIFLLERLTHYALNCTLKSSNELGLDPNFIEAMAFAWFAKQTLSGQSSNLPAVTGAKRSALLGGVYFHL